MLKCYLKVCYGVSVDLSSRNVDVKNVVRLKNVCCGQAYIFSYPDGDNSIILSGGANTAWNKEKPLNDEQANIIKRCAFALYCIGKILLLQREIPDFVNIEAAKIAKANSTQSVTIRRVCDSRRGRHGSSAEFRTPPTPRHHLS
eukprot:TRINITY_DN3824_c0_g1_i1.p3 TRINITY_DN3824_c0_g1~~TRINITY_DN3824_c0_g1_i1.p3  ORF type:complete len:144 (-),score=5.10 TRINITY_DN3824_c0_g1_i1:630-1061(-)